MKRINALIQSVNEFEECQEALDAQAMRLAEIAMNDPNSLCAKIVEACLARMLSEGSGDESEIARVFGGRMPHGKDNAVAEVTVGRKNGIVGDTNGLPEVGLNLYDLPFYAVFFPYKTSWYLRNTRIKMQKEGKIRNVDFVVVTKKRTVSSNL